MAIYRGEGGATDVEPAPGDTEFAGGIIVEGDILIDSSVGGTPGGTTPHLEGLFIADTFDTGTQFPTADPQLFIRGSVVANTIDLNRDLLSDNATLSAEKIEFAPGLMFHYPHALGARTMEWKEVAP